MPLHGMPAQARTDRPPLQRGAAPGPARGRLAGPGGIPPSPVLTGMNRRSLSLRVQRTSDIDRRRCRGTAAFTKSILPVQNAGLGVGFDPDAFDHVALWDAGEEWIEMRLGRCKIRWSRCPGLISWWSSPRARTCGPRCRPSSARPASRRSLRRPGSRCGPGGPAAPAGSACRGQFLPRSRSRTRPRSAKSGG